MYAYIQNAKITELHDTLPQNWKNISGLNALSESDLVSYGWYKVELDPRDFDESEYYIVNTDYNIVGSIVKQVHNLQLVKDSPALHERLWDAIRIQRDRKMNEFEWRYNRYLRETRLGLETSDDIEKLDSYMNALADVTKQENPLRIIWPTFN